ncbi:5'-methylthioadenosine/S-adenosylhomocysteine nucleosidase [Lentzea sp. NPDC005914]|uniref:5'-methylthioadenosine/S-adenosylhomocysteine nucleosidase family protein n=1 Tax=Lentzea sp. NPDC005914 TaxID=3154572 RepID=UPI0033D38B64
MTADSAGTVVMLTALDLEYEAVRGFLRDPTPHAHHAGTLFEVGVLDGQAGRIAIAVIGAGNPGAATITERAITEFRPCAVLFVGVAGALHDDLDLGAVVVATKVYGYHGGLDENGGFRTRPQSWEADHALDQLAREVSRSGEWKSLLQNVQEAPVVHFRPIAAGEVVLNSQDTPLAEQLRNNYNDAAAIEMESAGSAKAAHLNRTPFMTVRGISDKADGDKHTADAAAVNAAAFAITLAQLILISRAGKTSSARPAGSWWKRRRQQVAIAVLIVLSFFVGALVKHGDLGLPRWFRPSAGQAPVYVTAKQLPPAVGEEPLVRLLPDGVTDQVRQLMSGSEWLNAPQELGIPVGLDTVQIVVQAKESRLLLTGLRLVVDERHAPLAATLVFHGTQGGPGKPIQVHFDADAPEATTKRGTPARNPQGRDYFQAENYELDPGQSVEFRATVSTRQCHCRWHLEVDVSLNGEIQPIQVRRGDGSLFEISASTPRVEQVYVLPHPSDLPRTAGGGSIGGWAHVPTDEFCKTSTFCDPSAWPKQ